MLTFGTAIMMLLGVILLVGMFYVLATGRLPSMRQREGGRESEGNGWEGRYAASCKVVLHNDDRTKMDRVVRKLRKVIPGISLKHAVSIMLEAHTKGKAVVTECHKELAEVSTWRASGRRDSPPPSSRTRGSRLGFLRTVRDDEGP